MKKVVIIGSTGSIGEQTIDVLRNQDSVEIYALTAGKNLEKHKKQLIEIKPKYYDNLEKIDYKISDSKLIDSNEIVNNDEIDFILFASSGSEAYEPIFSAIENGINVGLTNKEVIVTYGPILFDLAKKKKSRVFPVDSEPSAIWQCIEGEERKISKIILTASGGIFRDKKFDELKNITPKDATSHPNWNMGKKITVDSSTMMNKIFEIVETSYMFNIPFENIDVLIHRQSIVHSMVEFFDGSIKAQLSKADMKLPIQYALDFPNFNLNYENKLDFSDIQTLTFSPVDRSKYPCYDFSIDYIKKGKLYISALSILDEILVNLFLDEKISYVSIPLYLEKFLDKEKFDQNFTIDNIIEVREYLTKKVFKELKI